MGVVVGKQKFQKTTTTAEIALAAELTPKLFSLVTVHTVQPIM